MASWYCFPMPVVLQPPPSSRSCGRWDREVLEAECRSPQCILFTRRLARIYLSYLRVPSETADPIDFFVQRCTRPYTIVPELRMNEGDHQCAVLVAG